MRPAGFWIRFLAYLIDGFVLGIPLFIIQMILGFIFVGGSLMTTDFETQDPSYYDGAAAGIILVYYFIMIVLSIAAGIFYYGLMTASKYQGTLGKMLLGLKVVNEAGEKVSKGQAIGRYFAYILSGVVLYIGFIMIAFGPKKGLHDYICNTRVVYKD
ncbi:RDD family protein [Metabacillus fastidiosus]|uniref:RDD family protein n=1 Tax=Metabacillus fastidiosus TaxID=1458 RepID=UPI003D279E9D